MANDCPLLSGILRRIPSWIYLACFGALFLSMVNFYAVDATQTCPDKATMKKKNITGVTKAWKKPCVSLYEYCNPKTETSTEANCPGKLVFNPQRLRCDLRKACKEVGQPADLECMHSPCGLYGHIDCKKYFVCSGGTKIFKECPGDTVFDFELEICKIEGKCRYPVEPIIPSDLPPDDLIDPIEDSDRIQCAYHDMPEADEFGEDPDGQGVVLDGPKVTDWGKWMPWKNCDPDHYITGLQAWKRTHVDSDGKQDHAGVVSVGFRCENFHADNEGGKGKKKKPEKGKGSIIGLAAKGAPDTKWDYLLSCEKGAAIGFQLAQQEDQGDGDDVATDNVKLICSCGVKKEIYKPYHEEEEKYLKTGGQLGEWTDQMICKPKQALCGFRPQFQDFVKAQKVDFKKADMTGLNQIKFKCCNVPSPSSSCEPKITKKYIHTCDNREGYVKRPCPFDTIVGTIYNFQTAARAASFYTSIGYTMEESMADLEETLKSKLSKCDDDSKKPCPTEWLYGESNINVKRMFQLAHKEESEVNITAGVSIKLQQTVVQCGIFEVYTNQIHLEPHLEKDGKEKPEEVLHLFEGSVSYYARRRKR